MAKRPERFSVTGDRGTDIGIANRIMDDLGVPNILEILAGVDAGQGRPGRMSQEQINGTNLLLALLLPVEVNEKPNRRRKDTK
ncbi:MAG: hypothetical protein V4437_03010 [Patescibacteria group bacterium]